MRILLVNTGHPAEIKGGAEAAVLDLAHRLVARGHSVALAVHHAGRRLERATENGLRVYRLPNRNLYFGFDGRKRPAPLRLAWHALDSANPLMAAAFGEILDEEKPDVLNTHVLAGLSPLVWREARRRAVPIVHYLHEYGAMCPRGSGFRDGRLCDERCTACALLTRPRKRLSGLVDTIVGVSRYTLERHLAWDFFPKAQRTVIPNIFDGLVFQGRPTPSSRPLRIGYFGRLIPDKGAHLLVEAVKALPPERCSLDIAGTGDEAYVAALAAAAPANVRFLGWTRAPDFFPDDRPPRRALDLARSPAPRGVRILHVRRARGRRPGRRHPGADRRGPHRLARARELRDRSRPPAARAHRGPPRQGASVARLRASPRRARSGSRRGPLRGGLRRNPRALPGKHPVPSAAARLRRRSPPATGADRRNLAGSCWRTPGRARRTARLVLCSVVNAPVRHARDAPSPD